MGLIALILSSLFVCMILAIIFIAKGLVKALAITFCVFVMVLALSFLWVIF